MIMMERLFSREVTLLLVLLATPGTIGFLQAGVKNHNKGAVLPTPLLFTPSISSSSSSDNGHDGQRGGGGAALAPLSMVSPSLQLKNMGTHSVDLTHNMEPSTNMIRREIMVSSHNNNNKDHRPADNNKDPLSVIDFNASKSRERLSLPRLAARLDQEVFEKEWFVTGHVNPKYFHHDFKYKDADVEICSLEDYARDAYNLFDQSCSRAEVVATIVNPARDRTITCTWRCSGRANLLWGVPIKPFIVTTHWEVDSRTGLICRQVDEYSLPQWDLLVSAVFPFLNGILTAPPAPPVPPRRRRPPLDTVMVPRSPLHAWAAKTGFTAYLSSNNNSNNNKQQQQPDTGNPLDDFVEFLTEDKNSFFDWKPPAVTSIPKVVVDKNKLVTPEQQQEGSSSSNNNGDGLPTIRSPTLWDRVQAFVPDHPEMVENLKEATRRTESRRSRRYYYAVNEEQDDQQEPEHAVLQEVQIMNKPKNVVHQHLAP